MVTRRTYLWHEHCFPQNPGAHFRFPNSLQMGVLAFVLERLCDRLRRPARWYEQLAWLDSEINLGSMSSFMKSKAPGIKGKVYEPPKWLHHRHWASDPREVPSERISFWSVPDAFQVSPSIEDNKIFVRVISRRHPPHSSPPSWHGRVDRGTTSKAPPHLGEPTDWTISASSHNRCPESSAGNAGARLVPQIWFD